MRLEAPRKTSVRPLWWTVAGEVNTVYSILRKEVREAGSQEATNGKRQLCTRRPNLDMAAP